MEGLTEIIMNVWEEGFLGIGITEIIVSLIIFIALGQNSNILYFDEMFLSNPIFFVGFLLYVNLNF